MAFTFALFVGIGIGIMIGRKVDKRDLGIVVMIGFLAYWMGCMIQVKAARLVNQQTHEDSWLDIAGYVGCVGKFSEPVAR